jgi:hypothetical protein
MGAQRRAAVAVASIVGLVATVTGVGGLPAVAGAKAPSIKVTPSTGLKPGQTVKINGTGFGATSDVVALECVKGATDPSTCDLGNFEEGTTDAHGAATFSFTAHRTLLDDSGFEDCVKVACEIVVSPGEVFDTEANAPIAFDPKAPLPKTALTAKPSTKLRDEQTLNIAGSGFTLNAGAGDGIEVIECITVSLLCGPATSASEPGPSGRFSTVLSVKREIANGPGMRFDCAKKAGSCELLAIDEFDVDYHATTPLAFDASLPPPPPPSLVVKPNTKLPYYARVTITGKHWNPNDFLEMLQCATNDPSACAFLDTEAIADTGGAFQVTPILQRELPNLFDPQGKSVDCAKVKGGCELIVEDSVGDSAVAPLAFDPKAPIPPAATLTATPAAPYTDGEVLHLKGAHYPPDAQFSITECALGTEEGVCETSGGGATNRKGALATTFQVERTFPDFEGTGVIDCAKANVVCTLEVDSEGGASAVLPLTFKKGGSAAAVPATGRRITRRPRSAWLASATSRAAVARAAVPRPLLTSSTQ